MNAVFFSNAKTSKMTDCSEFWVVFLNRLERWNISAGNQNRHETIRGEAIGKLPTLQEALASAKNCQTNDGGFFTNLHGNTANWITLIIKHLVHNAVRFICYFQNNCPLIMTSET